MNYKKILFGTLMLILMILVINNPIYMTNDSNTVKVSKRS